MLVTRRPMRRGRDPQLQRRGHLHRVHRNLISQAQHLRLTLPVDKPLPRERSQR